METIDHDNQHLSGKEKKKPEINRRNFLRLTGAGSLVVYAHLPLTAGPFVASDFVGLVPVDKKLSPAWIKSLFERGNPQVYKGEELKYIGMPVGGICAGQVYLGGDGQLWFWDIFNKKAANTWERHYAEPMEQNSPVNQGFALQINNNGVSEIRRLNKQGFENITFRGEYPIGKVNYATDAVKVELEAFSPFIPLSINESSIPTTIMSFTVTNTSQDTLEATLFGWLENAICQFNRAVKGKRNNRIIHHKGSTYLNCTVEKGSDHIVAQRPDILFEDWKDEKYINWTPTGNAFGTGPILKSAVPGYQGDVGGNTQRVVNSHASSTIGNDAVSRDMATGTLTSKPFVIDRKFINFWLGGGNHKNKTCLNLLIDNKVIRSTSGLADNMMTIQSFNVYDIRGKTATLQLVDAETGGWGNIGAGSITFSDLPPSPVEFEKMFDHGTMSLALLNNSGDYSKADAGSDGLSGSKGKDASVSLEDHLTGAIGHSMKLKPGESKVITFALTWHFPNLTKPGDGRHYAALFANSQDVAGYVTKNFDKLVSQTKLWRDTWYDSTLPYWFLDRTFANASTLATSTSFRFRDGKFWGWEGVSCCEGTCTHVWHYEQTMGRIFPELDIVLREKTDFNPDDSYKGDGVIEYRGKGTGIAIDGQAGIILRSLRDHQMSPNNEFLKRNYPKIKKALEWMVAQDGTEDGIIKQNQHNTLDAQWFGEVAWLSGLYLAALRAGEVMAIEMEDPGFSEKCHRILETGRKNFVEKMWNGEYFIQTLDPKNPNNIGSYDGCEIDQVLGQGWAWQVGLGQVLPKEETKQALKSLWKYNFTPDVGPFRAVYKPGRWYAMAGEAGTIMCSWPRGEQKRVSKGVDFYFNECMNGFEHQLSGHMIWEDMVLEGLAIERAIHDRYHAIRRNPWNEVECGDHYARSMASYGVFLAACGFEIHGPKGHIGFAPRLTPENFKAPFTSPEGWGTYEQKNSETGLKAKISIKYGKLRLKTISLALKKETNPDSVQVTINRKNIEGSLILKDGKANITLAKEVIIETGGILEIQC
jgi:uncharacterized protein (DUF608 family)